MTSRTLDLRAYPTAYECRDQLPALSAWMSPEDLKLVPIWKGTSFESNKEYFDLNNPARGAFVASGDEARPNDYTYACRDEVPERVWAKLATWRQMVSEDQGQAIDGTVESLGIGHEHSASGEARPLPR